MTVFLVSYDLRKENRANWPTAYKPLWEALARFPHMKPMESLWFIDSRASNPNEIYDYLRPYIDENDTLFISEITRNWQGWISENIIDWLKARGV